MEATLELVEADAVEAVQDLGAAGLTCASSEIAARSGVGMRIDVDKVPRRAQAMSPYEVMLSESQERMLVVARPGRESDVERVFKRWELHGVRIGEITENKVLTILSGDDVVAIAPAGAARGRSARVRHLAVGSGAAKRRCRGRGGATSPDERGPPARTRRTGRQDGARKRHCTRSDSSCSSCSHRRRSRREPSSIERTIRWSAPTPFSAREPTRPCSVSKDGATASPSRSTRSRASRRSIRSSAPPRPSPKPLRNIVCVGAEPLAITDCLNLGNPERPEGAWQLERTIAGISAACEALDVPVVSGNVSLYNATRGADIWPTAVIGAVGHLDDVTRHIPVTIGPPRRRRHAGGQRAGRHRRVGVRRSDGRARWAGGDRPRSRGAPAAVRSRRSPGRHRPGRARSCGRRPRGRSGRARAPGSDRHEGHASRRPRHRQARGALR